MPDSEILRELWSTAAPRLLSVRDYHRMLELEIVGRHEHIELLEGVIVRNAAQSPPEARILQRLGRQFVRELPDAYVVRIQLPITLGEHSEPVPDLAVVSHDEAEQRDRHPRAAPLIVEVSHSTLKKDRRVMAALYARSGIEEYWIVNDQDGWIEVHRDADTAAGQYRSVVMVRPGERLRPASLPGPEIDVAELLQ